MHWVKRAEGGNPYHDEKGKFTHGPGGSGGEGEDGEEGGGTVIEGGEGKEFEQAQREEIQEAADGLTARYKAPLRKVYIADVGNAAGKGKDNIYLNPTWTDPAWREQRTKDFDGLLVSDGTLSGTIKHEYGHILDGQMLANDRPAYDEIQAYLDEPIDHMGGKVPRLLAGGNGPSPYSFENRREYVAEAFADWYINGDNAHPFSQHIGRIIDRSQAR